MNILLLPNTAKNSHTFDITDTATLQHLHQVLQINIGDIIKIGIKNEQLGTAKIADISPTKVVLSDINCQTAPPKKLPLSVVLALPRPKVLRRLMLDMTAMGVEQVFLVNSYRTEKSYWQSPLLSKIDDYIHEGLQQACDTIPMKVSLHKRLKPFVEDELPAIIANQQAIIAHPYANNSFNQICQRNTPTVMVIGAEGGFIPYEVDLFAKQGCVPVHIGERILRTENAVSVLCGHFLLA
ncbi:16S rRNA (uracil(1498)-N(3))-methyltransferase [Faucicola mancuniensis]|uniref:16S rRNA (uracil(1498)-N(3))-methyltransferase n=1 Tax=Faucicola mancuniensis TaxID=1309795 RepID=UPI003977C1DC